MDWVTVLGHLCSELCAGQCGTTPLACESYYRHAWGSQEQQGRQLHKPRHASLARCLSIPPPAPPHTHHACAPAQGNVRRILRYLIPAKMLLGELPSDRLLDTYHLQEYRDLKKALQAGDVGLLNKALQVRMDWDVCRQCMLAMGCSALQGTGTSVAAALR